MPPVAPGTDGPVGTPPPATPGPEALGPPVGNAMGYSPPALPALTSRLCSASLGSVEYRS